jgi:RNA recognition motif-containing protein
VLSRPLLSSPKPTSRFLTTRAFLPARPVVSTVSFQRRFNSEEARKENEENSSSAVAEPVEDAAEPAPEPVAESNTTETAAGQAPQTPFSPGSWQIEPNNNVYVGNLFFEAKEDDLREFFSKYGEVAEVKMVNDIRGYSKGYVFFCFI